MSMLVWIHLTVRLVHDASVIFIDVNHLIGRVFIHDLVSILVEL